MLSDGRVVCENDTLLGVTLRQRAPLRRCSAQRWGAQIRHEIALRAASTGAARSAHGRQEGVDARVLHQGVSSWYTLPLYCPCGEDQARGRPLASAEARALQFFRW